MVYETPRNDRPPATPSPPLPGEKGAVGFLEDEDRATDSDMDFEDNELHAAGKTCVVCNATIGPTDEVRRHLDGTFQHEVCPS
jgi:hypothetical protein